MAQWLGRPEVGTPRALALSVAIYGLLAIPLLIARRRSLAVTPIPRYLESAIADCYTNAEDQIAAPIASNKLRMIKEK